MSREQQENRKDSPVIRLGRVVFRPFFRLFGLDVVRSRRAVRRASIAPRDFDDVRKKILASVRDNTMTGPERIGALIDAVQYVVRNEIAGAFLECGVWKGGSAMAMALALREIGVSDRDIYLFDTFEGMPDPAPVDVALDGRSAKEILREGRGKSADLKWIFAPLEEVRRNMLSTGYPEERMHFIKGRVEETVPGRAPERIALLRLDTDWYESTRHELESLYPRLSTGGLMIIDDYGHWQGARKAVDEYIERHRLRLFLSRVDYTCRIAVKQAEGDRGDSGLHSP